MDLWIIFILIIIIYACYKIISTLKDVYRYKDFIEDRFKQQLNTQLIK